MNPAIIRVILIALVSTVVVGHSASAADPQRQLAEERRRISRPLVVSAQPVQPALQQFLLNQRERESNQAQRFAVGNSSGNVGINQLQSVSIERFKVQSDTPVEYQFEALQTMNLLDGNSILTEQEVNAESIKAVEAELPGDASVEEVAIFEVSIEELAEEAPQVEEKIDQFGVGHSVLGIIEEENRIVVMQVGK